MRTGLDQYLMFAKLPNMQFLYHGIFWSLLFMHFTHANGRPSHAYFGRPARDKHTTSQKVQKDLLRTDLKVGTRRWVLWPYHLAASFFIMAFAIFKSGFIGLPLFWDEAWVYAPAVRAMFSNGPSLLPDAIDAELTRGHPLLFHFLTTSWMKIWGTSNTVLHSFALTVSVLTLIAVHVVGSRIASPLVGAGATLMVAVNEAFLAQSGILLPEVLLALFTLLAVWMFIERRTAGYMIFGTCALLTKESALVMVLALITWQVVLLFTKKHCALHNVPWRWMAVTCVPVFLASLFFAYQYKALGWFFYPEHLGMMSFDPKTVHYQFKLAFAILFDHQGMELTTYAFGLVVPLIWRAWRTLTGISLVILYVAAIKVLVGRWAMPPLPTLIFTLSCFILIFFLQFMKLHALDRKKGEFTGIGLIFLVGFLLFSALNFFADRYLISLLPFIAIGIAIMVHGAVSRFTPSAFPILIFTLCAIRLWHIGRDDLVGDTRLSYKNLIEVHAEMIRYLENKGLHNAPVLASFTEVVYLTDPDAGYLSGPVFRNLRTSNPEAGTYILYTSVSPGAEYEARERSEDVSVVRFTSGKVWGEIHHWRVPQAMTMP